MSTAMALAANLQAVMVERALSPEDVARGCSLALATVHAALFQEGVSTLAEIDRLAGWLGISPADLLTEHDAMRQGDLTGARAQWQQYWALPADQRAQVDAFMRVRERAGHSHSACPVQTTRHPILSEAERRVVMGF
jgi:hypothetical protein